MDQQTHSHGSLGAVVGTIVIIGILILGGLYVWGAKIEKDRQAKSGAGNAVAAPIDPNSPEMGDDLPPPPPPLGMEAALEGSLEADLPGEPTPPGSAQME